MIAARRPGANGVQSCRLRSTDVRTILVTAEEGLGDCVLMLPLVFNLRRAFPHSWIFLLTAGLNPLIFSNLQVDGFVSEADLKNVQRPTVDLLLDTHTGRKPRRFFARTYVHFPLQTCRCGDDYEIRRGEKPAREEYLDFLRVLGHEVKKTDFNSNYKLLPMEKIDVRTDEVFAVCKTQYCSDEEYLRLFEKYASGKPVITGGSAREQEIAAMIAEKHDVVNLSGRLTIPQFIYLIRHCRKLISFDSLAVHLADAFRKQVVCFYKRFWNYRSYVPSITRRARVITFENIGELLQ